MIHLVQFAGARVVLYVTVTLQTVRPV